MGCFDTVHFRCPRCHRTLEVQSKAAECSMLEFPSGAVPIAIAADIIDEKVWCETCGQTWTIGSSSSDTVNCFLYEDR